MQPASLPAVELLERAAKDVELPYLPNTIVIVDYGASAGHNSLLPIGAVISIMRGRTDAGRPIVVFHSDVAENDYDGLFDCLASDPQSYLGHDTATFASAIGTIGVRAGGTDEHRHLGVEFVGSALAQPRARRDTRPRAHRLQP